jgi:hypothetical protein
VIGSRANPPLQLRMAPLTYDAASVARNATIAPSRICLSYRTRTYRPGRSGGAK